MLCVFHRERTLEGQGTYCRCISVSVEPLLLLLCSSNKGIVVHDSPLSSDAPSTVAPFTNLQCCAFHKCSANRHCRPFYKCTIHQSPVLCLLQGLHQSPLLHHSLIASVVPYTSVANIITVAFYSCTVLQCCFIC